MIRPQLVLPLGALMVLGACAAMPGGDEMAAAGACPADAHQDWVGQRIDVLNDVELPEGTRVMFPTTPATTDFRADRMNVVVDGADTISQVYCG